MRIGHTAMAAVAGWAAALLAGCHAPPTGVPTGQWRGQGIYVDCEAFPAGTPAATTQRVQARRYDTMLTIEEGTVAGHEGLLVEIISRRGTLMNLGNTETRLRFGLIEMDRLPGGHAIYAAVEADAADSPRRNFASASAVQTRDGVVLQVCYSLPTEQAHQCFADTFEFLADRVVKTGRMIWTGKEHGAEKLMSVYWVESLHPDSGEPAAASHDP